MLSTSWDSAQECPGEGAMTEQQFRVERMIQGFSGHRARPAWAVGGGDLGAVILVNGQRTCKPSMRPGILG